MLRDLTQRSHTLSVSKAVDFSSIRSRASTRQSHAGEQSLADPTRECHAPGDFCSRGSRVRVESSDLGGPRVVGLIRFAVRVSGQPRSTGRVAKSGTRVAGELEPRFPRRRSTRVRRRLAHAALKLVATWYAGGFSLRSWVVSRSRRFVRFPHQDQWRTFPWVLFFFVSDLEEEGGNLHTSSYFTPRKAPEYRS